MRLHLPDDDLEVSHRIYFSEALREGDGPARGPEIVLNLQKFFIIRGAASSRSTGRGPERLVGLVVEEKGIVVVSPTQ